REDAKGSRRNKFTFWRERRAADARRRDAVDVGHRRGSRASSGRAPLPRSGTARWLCCSLLTYRPGFSSSLVPRQRAWGPAAKCEVISARALSARKGDCCILRRTAAAGIVLFA